MTVHCGACGGVPDAIYCYGDRQEVYCADCSVVQDDGYEDEVLHVYARPPRPGDRARCGHLWTPEEAQGAHRGTATQLCIPCRKDKAT